MTDGAVEFIDVTLEELVRHLNGEVVPLPRSTLKGDHASNAAHRERREPSAPCPQSAGQASLTDFVLVDVLSEIEGSFLLVLEERPA